MSVPRLACGLPVFLEWNLKQCTQRFGLWKKGWLLEHQIHPSQ